MKKVEGQHIGENLAAVLLDIIRDYRIQNRLGYFMGNNVSNNDTMLQMVAEELAKEEIQDNSVLHRL